MCTRYCGRSCELGCRVISGFLAVVWLFKDTRYSRLDGQHLMPCGVYFLPGLERGVRMRSLSISSRKIRRGAVFLLRTLLVFDALIERFCDGVTSGSKSDMTCMGC